MLTLKNIHWKADDGREILKGIDLEIKTGRLTVVTGPNGGGKTTLAKVISGIEQPSAGTIELDGEDLTHMDVTERARAGVAYGFQQPVRFKGITVRDMIELAHGGAISEEDLCSIMDKVGVCTRDYVDREVNASLSGGEIKRIEIASVLARSDAKLMIFDEPEAGIDLWSFNGLISAFEELNRGDKTLMVISHQERLLEIADDIVVLADGRVRLQGPGKEILPQLASDEKSGVCPIGNDLAREVREAL